MRGVVKNTGSAIGVVAPSAVVPPIELKMGLERIKAEGFRLKVHPQCRKKHVFFAGTDEERAKAFYEYAMSGDIGVIWCARGGYGASRMLPILDRLCAKNGKPKAGKLLVGYSDSTCLLEYVTKKWNWQALHASMPGLMEFSGLSGAEFKTISAYVKRGRVSLDKRLKFLTGIRKTVSGELIGGNLSVLASLVGTPYAAKASKKILFLEDVSEGLYRIDRMMQQLSSSGALDGVKAIVLGTFHDCSDLVMSVLKSRPKTGGAKPKLTLLRPRMGQLEGLKAIFEPISKRFGIPVYYGLDSGHGGGSQPLPIGAEYRVMASGRFELLKWNWLKD